MRRWRQNLRFLAAVQLLPALESGEETLVGGQAVLEGVMMRSPHAWGIAVRKPSGEIVTHSEPLERPSEQHKWMGWPVVRGVMTLGHAMTLGFRALKFSANAALDEISADQSNNDGSNEARDDDQGKNKKKFEITGWMAGVNMAFSIAFFIFMYKYLPLVAATELKKVNPVFGQQFLFNLVDGLIRIAMFLLFVWGVSLWKDIRRVYEYHGAEHKTVFAFENGDPLEHRGGAEVFDLSSAVRNELPDDGDDHLDGRVHVHPGDNVLGALCGAHYSAAADCRRFLRDHSFCRQASRLTVRPDDGARTLAAEDHNPASG